mmetsp:Transcript_17034/g.36945  ORF Transcript_17034/g.36945 Transcript_17034/m.36945 type:complete len:982 (+) Transcript_17034:2-2947(+)
MPSVVKAFASPEEIEERGEAMDATEESAAKQDINGNGGQNAKPEKKNKNNNKKMILLSLFILSLLGLIIGLSVGLTQRSKRSNDTTDPDWIPPDTNTAGEGSGIGSLQSATMYTSSDSDPIPYSIQGFNDGILAGYDDCQHLREDLYQAAAHLANVVINRNVEHWYGGGFGGGVKEEEVAMDMVMDTDNLMADAPATEAAKEVMPGDSDFADDAAASEAGEGEGGESDWQTNTQVEGVDEADVVKSDGTSIFAAYGDRLVHFDTTGRKLSETTMPAPYFDEKACSSGGGGVYPKPEPMVDEVAEEGVGGRRRRRRNLRAQSHPATTSTKRRRQSSIMADDMYWYPCYRPRARIESLLLEGDRLVVIVSGYGGNNGGMYRERDDEPILGDAGTTKVRVYDINAFVDNPTTNDEEGNTIEPGHPLQLKLVGVKDLPGTYAQKGGRSIGSRAYIVTNNYVNTWYHFQRHFDRWQVQYDGLDNDAYVAAASQYATDEVIPNFVDRLLGELVQDGSDLGECSHVQQLSVYQTGNVDSISRSSHWWDDGIFNGLAQVTSLDLDQAPVAAAAAGAEPMLETEKSVAFVPSTWGTTIYATRDMLFLASQGYDEHPLSRSGVIQTTFILGFRLDGDGAAKGTIVGKAPGTVLNQFSMDFYDGHLRVATTTWSDWVCPFDDEETGGATEDATNDGDEDVNFSQPMPDIEEEPTFCGDTRTRGPQNQITVLSTESGEVMNEVGYLGGLGKPGESIYAVRFIKDKGFVVTFERSDPFYTLDLQVPSNPLVVGELEISGYSSYIHPTEDENILIAVGEDADNDGRVLGVQLTLFGVHDFSNPTLLARYNIEKSHEQWSSSEVNWDHRAFRYLRESQRVILPAQVQGYRGSEESSFDGFYVFKINKDDADEKKRIQLKHRIDLAPEEDQLWYCYSPARLAARSMLFSGNALLMKNHALESHDLDAEPGNTFLWRLDMDDAVSEKEKRGEECYYWW